MVQFRRNKKRIKLGNHWYDLVPFEFEDGTLAETSTDTWEIRYDPRLSETMLIESLCHEFVEHIGMTHSEFVLGERECDIIGNLFCQVLQQFGLSFFKRQK